MRLRTRPQPDVSAALPAVGPGRPTRPRGLAARPADDPAVATGGQLQDRLLRVVAAGGVAVLPQPRQHLEGQRTTRGGGLRPRVRRGRGDRAADHPAGSARPAAEVGDPVRVAVPSRSAGHQDTAGGGDGAGQAPGRDERGVVAGPGRGRVADADRAARAARRRSAGAAGLCPPPGLRPRRRRRLGGRVRPRGLADAPTRVRRQPAAGLHRDPAAVAAEPGQTVAALAPRHRSRVAGGQPRTPRADPVRGVLRPRGRVRARRHRPLGAGALPGRPARRTGRTTAPRRPHRTAQPIPARGPPAPLGQLAAGDRAGVLRRLPPTRRAPAPGAGRAGHGPDRGPRQPRPLHQPGLPAGHPDPDPGRSARHRRAEPAAGLPGHRRRRRSLPAL